MKTPAGICLAKSAKETKSRASIAQPRAKPLRPPGPALDSRLSALDSPLSALSSTTPGVVACPGLTRPANAGASFKDAAGRVHDLATARTLTLDEAAADPRLADLGFATANAVGALVLQGRLYPVFRKNARVVRIFACALDDFRLRSLAPGAAPRHLAELRATRVA